MTTPEAPRSILRGALFFTAIMLVGWLAATGVAWLLGGNDGVLRAGIAALLCLTPGWLVFAFAGLYGTAAPLGVVIVGTVARMAVVLVGTVAMKSSRPDLADLSFAVWLGVFYVLALATETTLLLTPRSRGTSPEA